MGEEVNITSQKPDLGYEHTFKSIYETQILELAEIRNPTFNKVDLVDYADKLKESISPVYVYFQWRNTVLETVPESEFFEIKTNRNKLLISKDEQEILYSKKVSIAGMSVGSSLLYGLVGSSFGGKFKVADDDVFSNSNLNRVQATVLDIGESKAKVACRKALEMNPFLEVKALNYRIDLQNSRDFLFDGTADILFEEIDDFRMKLALRELSHEYKIPLVMLTNLGDSVMIDVERYDTQQDTKPFNGLVSDEIIELIKHKEIDQETMKKLSVALVNKELVSERAIQTLQEIGISLVGRPQLYGTVALDGGVAPYLMRRILLDNNLISGRYSLQLEKSMHA